MKRLFLLLTCIPFYVSTADDKKEEVAKDISYIKKINIARDLIGCQTQKPFPYEIRNSIGYQLQKPFPHKESKNTNPLLNLFTNYDENKTALIRVNKTTITIYGFPFDEYTTREHLLDHDTKQLTTIDLSDPEGWFKQIEELYILQEKNNRKQNDTSNP